MDANSKQWPAEQIERRPTEALRPYERNARTHSKEQVAQIVAAIQEWGWTQPILVDEANGVIAGHGRLMAAKQLGITEVPVVVARGWSDAQKRAYVLADNQLALNSGWDEALLKVEIGALQEIDFDIGLAGFGDDFVSGLFAPPSEPKAHGALAERFGIPPFSVLNAREGWWQDRKRAWLALGIQSEVGRGGDLLSLSSAANLQMTGADGKRQRRANATPGGAMMPAADYKNRQRGNGKGEAI